MLNEENVCTEIYNITEKNLETQNESVHLPMPKIPFIYSVKATPGIANIKEMAQCKNNMEFLNLAYWSLLFRLPDEDAIAIWKQSEQLPCREFQKRVIHQLINSTEFLSKGCKVTNNIFGLNIFRRVAVKIYRNSPDTFKMILKKLYLKLKARSKSAKLYIDISSMLSSNFLTSIHLVVQEVVYCNLNIFRTIIVKIHRNSSDAFTKFFEKLYLKLRKRSQKTKLYIDISSMLSSDYLTGIQRVVQEVVYRLLNNNHFEVVLLNFDEKKNKFYVFNKSNFLDRYLTGKSEIHINEKRKYLKFKDFGKNSIFFDIDAVWNVKLVRSFLYKTLKALNIKIVTFVHDIIPITDPFYCDLATVCQFMNYTSAAINYSDRILTSTEATKDALKKLMYQTDSKLTDMGVTWLGSDFRHYDDYEKLDASIVDKVKNHKYVLLVGTLEPRKNHKILLEAFDRELFDRGLTLVFAGRYGWNIDELKVTMENHPQKNLQFYHLQKANDMTIDWLYRNAFLSVYPSFNEGFGLPIIEALERGCPVIASDCKVLMEVGKDYCEYFIQNNADSLIDIVKKYHLNSELYDKWKEKISKFRPILWNEVVNRMEIELNHVK